MADISRDPVVVDLVEEEARPAAAAPADGVVVVAEEGEEPLPKRAVEEPDGSIRLPLLHPVTLRYRGARSDAVREERLDELHLRRLTGADMRSVEAAAKGSSSAMVILARSARIAENKFSPIYDRMDAEDVADATVCVGRFLGSGRRTGR